MKNNDKKESVDLPTRSFEQFLKELEERKVDPEVIQRLRATIMDNQTITEAALRTALFTSGTDA